MDPKKCCKIGACGTILAGACCLGIAGILLGFFGATTALSYVNKYGDYVFIPSYIIFAALLVYSLMKIRKNWATYLISGIVIAFGVYVTVTAFSGGHGSHAMGDAMDAAEATHALVVFGLTSMLSKVQGKNK
jgi:hypothetical protein